MPHVHIENIFATPIYTSQIDVSGVVVEEEMFSSSGNGSDRIMLSENEQVLANEKYSNLKSMIDDHMFNFYHNVLGFGREVYPEMSSSWFVKSLPNQESDWHIHANSTFSGVLYLKANQDSGDILFRRDTNIVFPFQPPVEFRSYYNERVIPFKTETGLIVMFPSTMTHKVDRNMSNETRLSIAFNYFLKGSFKVHTGNLELK